jgi:ankyrin repeat protein
MNTADINGQTSLLLAAHYGHENIIKLLLGASKATPNHVDRTGRTPLSWARGEYYNTIVNTLLTDDHICINLADK